jgi:hypothetical protein
METLISFLDSIPGLSNLLAFLAFLLIIAIIVIGIVISIQANRTAIARKAARAAELGFQPIPHPDPTLEKAILDLFRHNAAQRLDLRNVFHRPSFDGDLYLFDVQDPTSEDTTEIVNSAIAVVSSGARLPSFSIHPRISGNGVTVSLVNRILAWGANLQDNKIVQFSGVPQFDDCFIVVTTKGTPEASVQEILTPDLRHMLSGPQAVRICARGEVIAFSSSMLTAIQKKEADERIRFLISEALRLSPYFIRK